MDIHKCNVFLKVYDTGNFTRAGELLGYTQSGITQMMKSLEKEVGFSLFIKDNHGVKLTEQARALVPSIQALINADEVVNQEIAALKGAKKGTIRIGTYLSCSMNWIPKIIKSFQEEFPDIQFHIIEGVEGDLAESIEERRVDLGFISMHHMNHNYTFLPVMDDPLYAIVPEDHPFAQLDSIPMEQLNDEDFIVTEYTPGSDLHRVLREYHLHPKIKYSTINEFSVLSMVEAGLGISILPGLILRGRSGKFVLKTLEPGVTRKLGLAYSDHSDLSPAAKQFLNYAKSYLLED